MPAKEYFRLAERLLLVLQDSHLVPDVDQAIALSLRLGASWGLGTEDVGRLLGLLVVQGSVTPMLWSAWQRRSDPPPAT